MVSMRLYDVGAKDKSVKWFYIAQLHHRVLFSITKEEDYSQFGSPAFELYHANNSFMKLAGVYINGYAFGQPDKLVDTLEAVIKDYSTVPKFSHSYPDLKLNFGDNANGARTEVLASLAGMVQYVKENKEYILEQRKENGIEGKY